MSDKFSELAIELHAKGYSATVLAAVLRGAARAAAEATREEIAKRFDAMPLLAKGVREVPLVLHHGDPQ